MSESACAAVGSMSNRWAVSCIDCGKSLVARGEFPPEKAICLHCDIVRSAPEGIRERIRETLQPI